MATWRVMKPTRQSRGKNTSLKKPSSSAVLINLTRPELCNIQAHYDYHVIIQAHYDYHGYYD